MAVAIGTRLGRYEILSTLGMGGMGEVYLAQDTKLRRPVALKLLHTGLGLNKERLDRFEQEAIAASGLNHPSILTIYETGQSDYAYFIATEFIDGITLLEHMARTSMPILEALGVAVQVASALSTAHLAGIVHRDIKPENIMLRRDGVVKVLDFGLAKLTETRTFPVDREAETKIHVKTDPGVVMGTASYMSPEQARGLEVDARTDIFSFGILLYEMVTGRKPFKGSTNSDVIVAILEKEPSPISHHEDIPEALEWIVTKALMKDREERYQTAKEILNDLRRLKQRLEAEAELERSGRSDETQSMAVATQDEPEVQTRATNAVTTHATSSAEYLVNEIKRHKGSAAVFAAFLIMAFAGVGYGLYKIAALNKPTSPKALKVQALTNNEKAGAAAASPDGKYIAYVMNDSAGQSLRIKHIATLSETEIVPPSAEADIGGTIFSPDGSYVYYTKSDKEVGTLYQVPVLGGPPRMVLEKISNGPITFSPDRERFAFVVHNPAQAEYALMIANKDGGNQQMLTTRKEPNDLSYPAWSPDGKTIAFAAANFDPLGFYWNVTEVSVEDKTEKLIGSQKWWWIGGLAWLSDQSGLVMSAREIRAPMIPIWKLSYPNGEVQRITSDTSWYAGMSLAADSRAMVASRSETRSNIWVRPGGAQGVPVQITSGKEDGSLGVFWTPDGRIVYATRGAAQGETWITTTDGSNKKLLAAVGGHHLSVSRDGRYIVFDSLRGGAFNVWRMGIDGSNLKQLTMGAVEFTPSISSDGQWVVYSSGTYDNATIWKVSIDGGESTQLTTKRSRSPTISPDGKWLAFYSRDEQPNTPWKLAIMPVVGGEAVKMFDIPQGTNLDANLLWTPDGRSIAYVNTIAGVSNIWAQPTDGGLPKRLTDFKSDQIFSFAWSFDGRQLALSRGFVATDVVLLSDFR